MTRLNAHEARAKLWTYLKRLTEGETILLCKRNIPIAEIRRLPAPRKTKRPLGLAKGTFKIPREFFKPLPAALLRSFRGE